ERKIESAIGFDGEMRNGESNLAEAEKGKLEEEIAQLKAEIAVLKAESGEQRAERGKRKVESSTGFDEEMRNGESNLAEAESGKRKGEGAIGFDGEIRNVETDIAKAGGDEGEVSSDMESEGTEGARISLEKDGEFGRRKGAHVLKAEGLKKVFGKKTAVFDVSFEVHTGEIVGLLGPNGAGKTTSFYMVVGFHKPTLGRIRLDDDDITELPMYKRAQLGIAYLPQEASVFKKLTVEENIWAILEMRKELSDEETIAAIPKAWKKLSEKGRRKILEATGDDKIAREDGSWSPGAEETDAILQKCGELSRGDKSKLLRAGKREILENLIDEFTIGHIRKQFAYTLSGGERRRTEIARALANNPKFILLDEPFAGIDPIAVSDIKGIIRHLAKRGIGVLITDHNVRDTLEITERAYIVSREDEMGGNIGGHILVSGDKKTIIENPEARHIYLGDNFKM
ncbi:MAG: ATP-binding cassette domain-containing protein, partial [Treponema sp.]|nr:ATP-binding cassette domain-containing protein [Treponema sp.]